MKEKNWSEVTRLPEEDLALMSSVRPLHGMGTLRFGVFLAMSAAILAIYLFMNYAFYPGYPVVTPRADQNEVYAEHYPPFRMDEWTNYSIAKDVLDGRLFERESLSRRHPVGFSVLAAPLTAIWGQTGPYFTNAFILWLSALLFFFLIQEMVTFPVAVGATLVLAFATPNLFYAASAFGEPLGQLLVLLSLYLFVRGSVARREWVFYLPAGLAVGLTLFVQPVLAFMMAPFLIFLAMEGSPALWKDRGALALSGGFFLPLIAYLVTGKAFTGVFFPYLFAFPYSTYNLLSHTPPGADPHFLLGIWKLLMDSPHGLVALMPMIMLAPVGFIAMWRGGYSMLAATAGSIAALAVLTSATVAVPVTGESVGARQLVPVLPLLILPLAFLWEEGVGERVWISVLTAFALLMSGFGWWAGSGSVPDTLRDQQARFVLLSRKNLLDPHGCKTPQELVSRFALALRDRNIHHWLETLAHSSRVEIAGIEREVFESLSRRALSTDGNLEECIESAEPADGIRLLIPNLTIEESVPGSGGDVRN